MFRWNKFEAVMCVELTNYLLKQGLPAGQITILTPYSSQLRYTRDWLPVR
jgi:superfamily I DNA and/or RNA helicase